LSCGELINCAWLCSWSFRLSFVWGWKWAAWLEAHQAWAWTWIWVFANEISLQALELNCLSWAMLKLWPKLGCALAYSWILAWWSLEWSWAVWPIVWLELELEFEPHVCWTLNQWNNVLRFKSGYANLLEYTPKFFQLCTFVWKQERHVKLLVQHYICHNPGQNVIGATEDLDHFTGERKICVRNPVLVIPNKIEDPSHDLCFQQASMMFFYVPFINWLFGVNAFATENIWRNHADGWRPTIW
jgi:hypothetical protein